MLIDDDESMRTLMRQLFLTAGYRFCAASSGAAGLAMLESERPDLLLLDVMMPGLDGYEVCRRVREQGRRVPIIFLTAKGDIVDMKTGYRAGGDDYVVKPFNNEELLLRVDALIRRRRDDLANLKPTMRSGSVTIGELSISFSSYEVRLRDKPVDLTAKEFEIVALLASSPGQVFTRDQIFQHLWGEDGEPDPNSITVFVHKIREKIEDNPAHPKYLLTVWRVGYKFAERVAVPGA
ncbi:MAG: response regulator transcription factor [Eggerthellaceae bacterium]|nr:response regulator transcription factor [Eggerthellaceae bacterium]